MSDILDEAAAVVEGAIATHTAELRAEALRRIDALLAQYPGGGVLVIVTGAGERGQDLNFVTNTPAPLAVYLMESVIDNLIAGNYGGG